MNKDKLLKDLFSGVMLGIVLWCIMFGVSLVINTDTDRLLPVFLIVPVAGVLGYVVIKASGDQKKANEMLSLLNSGQYEAYLSRMESYLKKDSSSALSGLLRVNGSVAYIKLGRFEEAI
ncbi:MAG: hypothetical protein HUJ58_07725, partial [Erysipelotrichaceae bacterium]|nr:hypothetical protein [Erysipelotrichaceae bacterium]